MSMSQERFAGLMRSFHDLELPPGVEPGRDIHHRIGRIRRRRAVYTMAAVLLLIVAVVLAAPRLHPEAVHPAPSVDLPASWTASDGVTYRRITTVDLDLEKESTTSVTVPVSGAPLA